MGEVVMHQVQYGKEAAHGDCAAADTRLLCQVTLPASDREVLVPGFGLGMRVPGVPDNGFVRRILAEGVSLTTPADRGGAYYQILPVLFDILLHAETPAEQTPAQGDYLWTYEPPLTAAETLNSIALEVGDNTRAYQICYVMSPTLEMTGNADTGEVVVTSTLFGDEVNPDSFTGAIAVPDVDYIIGKFSRVYVDTAYGDLGSNELSDDLVDWRLTINGGAKPKHRGSATRVFDIHGQGEISCTLELGLERGSAEAEAVEDYFFANTTTTVFVRLALDSGIQIGTGLNHSISFDICGLITSWQPFGRDANGNALDVVTITMGYDPTWQKAAQFNISTDVAAI